MIQLCMLLGGDYNEGIKNVGVVSAMEILHAFGGKHDSLVKFREFIANGNLQLEQDLDQVQSSYSYIIIPFLFIHYHYCILSPQLCRISLYILIC